MATAPPASAARVEIRPGKRKNSDGVWPLAMSRRSVSRISASASTPLASRKLRSLGSAAPIGMVIGVVDPEDVERPRRLPVEEPAIVLEMMEKPEAGDRQRHRRVRALGGELVEERPVERAPAGAEIAGDEGARARAVGEAGVLQKAAVGRGPAPRPIARPRASCACRRARRRSPPDRSSRRRAPGASVSFCGSARSRSGVPATVIVRIGDALAAVGGAAGLQDRGVVRDRVLGCEPSRRSGRIEAGRSGLALGAARAGAQPDGEEGERDEARDVRRQGGSLRFGAQAVGPVRDDGTPGV